MRLVTEGKTQKRSHGGSLFYRTNFACGKVYLERLSLVIPKGLILRYAMVTPFRGTIANPTSLRIQQKNMFSLWPTCHPWVRQRGFPFWVVFPFPSGKVTLPPTNMAPDRELVPSRGNSSSRYLSTSAMLVGGRVV